MFDIGAGELLLIAIVAIIVIGPKDMPLALRTAGRWIGKVRRVSNHFKSGIETMIREAEMEEMEKKWKEQNERIMAESQGGEVKEGALPEKTPEQALKEAEAQQMKPLDPPAPEPTPPPAPAPPPPAASAEARTAGDAPTGKQG